MGTPPTGQCLQGRVKSFDEDVGIGVVELDDGEELGFHCTAVADGSRYTRRGARVTVVRRPGHLGRWEAASITPLGGA